MRNCFEEFESKMRSAGMGDAAIRAFSRAYQSLLNDEPSEISEHEIERVESLVGPRLSEAHTARESRRIAQTVVIKLNGGLGTSMGLTGPKSLLEVRKGMNFLDLMVRQVQQLRCLSAARVRLLLMNSFSTSAATLDHLQRYAAEGFAAADEVELMQNQIPKIDASSGAPVDYPLDRALEWCPPGHGDLYPALLGSGWLDRLLDEGVRYAFVSNSDNLGAVMNPAILDFFAESGAPFLMECTRRTAADRKGGHLARRKSDGRLLLREVAQCPECDLESFQDIEKHQYFNTNNLWLKLDCLRDELQKQSGVLALPTIRNSKTLDPRDPDSKPVIQLECAMGAAIECFDGALAIEVPRSRFAPVKTTADLLALRSDAYEVDEGGQVRLDARRDGIPPLVKLGADYKLVDSIAQMEIPSLVGCRSLELLGPVKFAPGVVLEGDVVMGDPSGRPVEIAAGNYGG